MSYNIAILLNQIRECTYDVNMTDYYCGIIQEILNYVRCPHQLCKITLGSDRILQLKLTFKQSFKGNIHDIPISILLVKNMPNVPPEFYIDLFPGVMINKSNPIINPINNRIETNGLKNWNQWSKITPIIDEIRANFNQTFPICAAPSVQPNYSQGPPQMSNLYQPRQPPYANDMSKSMNNSQGPYNNQPGYLANNNNSNISTGYGANINPSYQAQMTPQQAHDVCKQILINEVIAKVEQKYKEESKKLVQQSNKFINYQKEFGIETEKLAQYLMNSNRITMESQNKLKEIQDEIDNTTNYINQNQSRQINSSNCMEFVKIGNNTDNLIISLLAKEAMIEEMLVITKKGIEKQAIDCVDAIKAIRSSTRSLFAIKYQREQLIDSSSAMQYNY